MHSSVSRVKKQRAVLTILNKFGYSIASFFLPQRSSICLLSGTFLWDQLKYNFRVSDPSNCLWYSALLGHRILLVVAQNYNVKIT